MMKKALTIFNLFTFSKMRRHIWMRKTSINSKNTPWIKDTNDEGGWNLEESVEHQKYGMFGFSWVAWKCQGRVDICKENQNQFKVSFSLKSEKALPPYCLKGDNVSIALTEQMTSSEFYKHCIEMVEVCQCRNKHDCSQCKKMGRSFGKNAGKIGYQNILENKTKI